MVHDLRLGVEIFSLLARIDGDIARRVAAARCRHCGGPLHQANYGRKPRGALLAVAGEAFSMRHSLCCGRRGCRRRALPPSLRFLGRRVYLGAVVLLASVIVQVLGAIRAARAATGVPGWTLRRWASWWTTDLPQLPVWSELRARFAPPPPRDVDLPRSLFDRLTTELDSTGHGRDPPSVERVVVLAARLLAPVTTRLVPDCRDF